MKRVTGTDNFQDDCLFCSSLPHQDIVNQIDDAIRLSIASGISCHESLKLVQAADSTGEPEL